MGKPRRVNYELIEDFESEPYRILNSIRNRFHAEIRKAAVVLAWRKALKPDVDGRLVLGKCVKVSDLNKELAAYDFIIVLNKEAWNSPEFTEEKKRALIDHELCHAAVALDKDLEEKIDERGRAVFRVRKHDIEEFREVVERHGCYKRDLEQFAEALLKKQRSPLLAMAEADQTEVRIEIN